MANNSSMRRTASMAIGAFFSVASSKNYQVSQTGRPKSRKTHSPHHQPTGVFDASIPCDLKLYTRKLLLGGYADNSFICSRPPKTTGSVGYFPRPIACEFDLGKAPSSLHR
jgi:hypothetical protein